VNKTLVHISDLHFGPPLRAHVAETLARDIVQLAPDALVVSGDLTMRGFHSQFVQARAYLDRFAMPRLVIPGNHDLPLFNPFERLMRPLARYAAHVGDPLTTALMLDGVVIVGLNSSGPVIPGGSWNRHQIEWAEATLRAAPPDACRIIVTHHHFLRTAHLRPLGMRGARRWLDLAARWGIELMLVGHVHQARVERVEPGIVVVQSGTATSQRGRGHEKGENSYHVIRLDDEHIRIEARRYTEEEERFITVKKYEFVRR